MTPKAQQLNFSNEGGVCGTTRLLKNVMGLWMLQGCRNYWSVKGQCSDYGELVELASHEPAFAHLMDPDDESFLRALAARARVLPADPHGKRQEPHYVQRPRPGLANEAARDGEFDGSIYRARRIQ